MSKSQGYNKRLKSTTLRVFYNERDSYEIIWDNLKNKFVVFRNNEFLRDLIPNVEISSSNIGVYDPNESYSAGDTFVTYINVNSGNEQYLNEGIYRCIIDASEGESPELFPDKWVFQGEIASDLTIDNIQDLRTELNDRVKYSDLSDDFAVNGSGGVSLNIEYVSISNYYPSDIPPVNVNSLKVTPESFGNIVEGNSITGGLVWLNSQPTDDVVISLESSDVGAATVTPTQMTFTTSNWDTKQQFSVDTIVDGDTADESIIITVSAAGSNDPNYDIGAIASKEVSLYILDNNTPGLVINPDTFVITEGEGDSININLASDPGTGGTGLVDLTFTNPNPSILEMSDVLNNISNSIVLSFHTSNWYIPQIINFNSIANTISLDTVVDVTIDTVDGTTTQDYAGIPQQNINITIEDLTSQSGEVQIGSRIWKDASESTDDTLGGIFAPNGNEANVATYGRLYTADAVDRILALNPGYRLPTYEDLVDLFFSNVCTLINDTSSSVTLNSGPITDDSSSMWTGHTPPHNWTNSEGVGLTAIGSRNANGTFSAFNQYGYYWHTVLNEFGVRVKYYASLTALDVYSPNNPRLTFYKNYYSFNQIDPEIAFGLWLIKDI